jgi:hypothetical protein
MGKSKRQKEMERVLKDAIVPHFNRQPDITRAEALKAMEVYGNEQFLKGSEHKKTSFNKIYIALGEFFLEASKIGKKARSRITMSKLTKGKVDFGYVRKEYDKALQKAFKKIVLTK